MKAEQMREELKFEDFSSDGKPISLKTWLLGGDTCACFFLASPLKGEYTRASRASTLEAQFRQNTITKISPSTRLSEETD